MGSIDMPVVPALRRFCRIGCYAVCAVATVVFVGGWFLGVPALRNLVPGTVEMKPLTAIGLFFSAAGLLFLLDTPVAPGRRRLAWACAAVPAVLGVAVLCEYVFRLRLGIDELLFRDVTGRAQGIAYPGRFAPTTALTFVLIGVALLALDLRVRRGWRPSELLAIPIGLIAATSVIGYIYTIPQFYGPASAAKMALGTAICFLVLVGGLAVARPHGRILHLATTDDPGGIMIRKLLPLAVGLPILVGWARLETVDAKVFSDRVATWWLSAVTVVGFSVLIWRVAARLSRYGAERGVLEAELHHLAHHDSLTGLLNRRRFDQEMLATAATANRYGHFSSLLIVDLDRMKEVNDKLGHEAGDQLLQGVADVFKARLRVTDRAARLGGDEFGVLLPNTALARATVVAETIRASIADSRGALGDLAWTTASIGIAQFSGDGERPDEIMAAADRAMYKAKRSGGNSVCTESAPGRPRSSPNTWRPRPEMDLAQVDKRR